MPVKPKIVPVDFETKGIEQRPEYPPEPVGVAVTVNGRKKYLAWGHPTQNNCTKAQAKKVLMDVFKNHIPAFHNSAFDIAVGMEWLGLPFPKKGYHDTLFLAYLHDPREVDLGLKPLAEKYLDMPPEEQKALDDWIVKNYFEANGIKVTKKNPIGAHIWRAPGKLVGKYAIGDIVRTEKLFNYMYPYIQEQGMLEAYNRELQCMPIFEEMSTTGVRVDYKRLKRDLKTWEAQLDEWETWIRKRLKCKDLDIGSPKQLADAMDEAGKISHWIKTEKGNRSVSKDNLMKVCTDEKLVEVLGLRSRMQIFISTFGRPWLESAEKHNGRVYPSFNQVRSTDAQGKGRGTRTGRPSSNNPNFLNVPRNQEDERLPNLRNYLIPDVGCVFIIRDYSQQELRILAHFEEGMLYAAYIEDPNMDAHDWVSEMITEVVNKSYPRKHVKIVNFGVVYGMGKPGTAEKIEGSLEEAGELLSAHAKALPGVKQLSKEIQKWAKKGNPIYTWGGREYFAEEPKMMNFKGRMVKRDFFYKLLNYLIQGSAADCTKEAMIRSNKALKKVGGRLVLQVYDELVACVPIPKAKQGMKLLKDSMESIEFDIPMLSDGKLGRKSWGEAKDYKD